MKDNNSEVLARIEAQIIALNKRVESLIAQSSHKPTEKSFYAKRDFDDRKMGKMRYKAVCTECGQACDVPFKPSGGRPVFCSDCFERQQGKSSFEPRSKKSGDFRKPPATTFKKKRG